VLGTIALILTGVRYGGHLTGWDLAPATAIIGLGQGMALPSLIGAALAHVPPERAGAAAAAAVPRPGPGIGRASGPAREEAAAEYSAGAPRTPGSGAARGGSVRTG
jgi:hypothetical protein